MSKIIIDAEMFMGMLDDLAGYDHDISGITYDEFLYDELKADAERFYVVENSATECVEVDEESNKTLLYFELSFAEIEKSSSDTVTLRDIVDLYLPSNNTVH
jgi:hypothetical protein